uniref:Myosin IXb n=1 Tax=Denticeps clupeoides TaxID=299321 RepID=A0AAY4BG69_9TELE
MSVTNGEGSAGQGEERCFLQVYARSSQETLRRCAVAVTESTGADAVVRDAAASLGLDPSKRHVLVEVREGEGDAWPLPPADRPARRFLRWPRSAQARHPPSEGYYFMLEEVGEDDPAGLDNRGFLPPEQDDYSDLCRLPVLTEGKILDALRRRFLSKKIYTYASNILIAINPFRFLPIYNPKFVAMYENHRLGKLPPHIFAIADTAFHAMLRKRVDQVVVISGESGSGKTHSTNFLIHCLTALSQKGYTSGVERTILGAGPVLEAFGNAKTAHNNNSSRFGKFIQVNYTESGAVRGAIIEKYLLEKCRLISREKCERNYHVFYYLLVGASEEERKEFKLLEPDDYVYLNQESLNLEDDELEIKHEFKRLQQAMEMVGFLPATKKQIFSVLSAILHLGNVTYQQAENGEGLDVGPPDVLDTLSSLLKVKMELLVQALTKRKATTANDTLILPYSLSEAITARDSMAKSLYSSLFDWIVLRINHALLNRNNMETSVPNLSIGVLDIFGFEDFRTNSFEQFCINYANEQLQYYCNQYIFTLEQAEYQAEGITWRNVDYTDNLGCIHLISKKPTGLFHLLDEESNFPHATEATLLDKFKQQHQKSPYFVPTPVMEPAFVIQHYAGKVKYQIKDFRERNMDHIRPDIVAVLRSSERGYLRQLVAAHPVAIFRWGILRATIRTLAAFNQAGRRRAEKYPGGHFKQPLSVLTTGWNLVDSSSLKFIVGLTLHNHPSRCLLQLHKKKKPPSISAQFQSSLNQLMETLKKAEPFFVRCIRSNAEKRDMHFDEALVLKQLRYTGMLETVRIRRSGYGAKFTFTEFINQFQVLLPVTITTPQKDIVNLLQELGLDKNNYQIGKTKVFLKEGETHKLQEALHKKVILSIIALQHWFRACLARKQFLYKRRAAVTIQVFFFFFFLLHTPLSNQPLSQVKRTLKISRATRVQKSWNSSLDREITDTNELRHLDEFLGNQINDLRNRNKDLSSTELIFLTATNDFREHVKNMYSSPVRKPSVAYKGLMTLYQKKVETLAEPNQKAEINLVVNLFQSILDGFIRGEIKKLLSEPVQSKEKQKKVKGVSRTLTSPLGHMFNTYQVTIMQNCELCGNFIWGMEKACMCNSCKMVCHHKCIPKIITDCSTRTTKKPGTLHFGVDIGALTTISSPVPMVIEMLLVHVEMHGLYTEGIYRKSGSAGQARELHQILETDPKTACLENYPIHTITGLVKRWLRELPDPLMTYNLYNDFLHAVDLPQASEQIQAIYHKLEELPTAYLDTLERLIFHLVRVAREENYNRMSANSLAIVFAPCILRCPDASDPLLSMKDVSRTTVCVELLINEQFRKYNEKMQEIQQLELAEAFAVKQLKLLRQNTVNISHERKFKGLINEGPQTDMRSLSIPTENTLIERIKSIKQEK